MSRRFLQLAMLLAALPASLWAQTPAFKQNCLQDAQNPTCTMASPVAIGDTFLIVLGINNPTSTGTYNTPTDSDGNTFAIVLGPTNSPGDEVAQVMWTATATTNNAAEQFSQVTGDVCSFYVIDLSNSSYFDTHGAQQAQPIGLVLSPNMTTQVAAEIVFGLGSTKTSQNGFTLYDGANFLIHVDRGTQVIEYDNFSGIQTNIHAEATTGASTPAVMGIVGFAASPPAGGGGGTPTSARPPPRPLQTPRALQTPGRLQSPRSLQVPK
jgi:hypothetical protein